MIVSQLLNTSFPSLNISDKPSFALQLMDDYDVLHLPVLSEEKYVGLVSKEDLLAEARRKFPIGTKFRPINVGYGGYCEEETVKENESAKKVEVVEAVQTVENKAKVETVIKPETIKEAEVPKE